MKNTALKFSDSNPASRSIVKVNSAKVKRHDLIFVRVTNLPLNISQKQIWKLFLKFSACSIASFGALGDSIQAIVEMESDAANDAVTVLEGMAFCDKVLKVEIVSQPLPLKEQKVPAPKRFNKLEKTGQIKEVEEAQAGTKKIKGLQNQQQATMSSKNNKSSPERGSKTLSNSSMTKGSAKSNQDLQETFMPSEKRSSLRLKNKREVMYTGEY